MTDSPSSSSFLGPYRYRFVAPRPLTIIGGPGEHATYGDVIKELEAVTNSLASEGWEFVGIEQIAVVPRKDLGHLLEPDFESRTQCPFLVLRRPSSDAAD
jgi:hypothetical protein